MKTILILVAKDFRLFWNDKVAVGLTFIVPMALITIFGLAFSGGGTPSGIRLLVVDEARNDTSAELIRFLQEEETFRVQLEKRIDKNTTVALDRAAAEQMLQQEAGSYRYALVLPEDLTAEDFGLRMELFYNPQNQIENGIVQGILQKTLFSRAMPLLMQQATSNWTDGDRLAFDNDMAGVIGRHFEVDPQEILREMQDGSLFGSASGGGTATGGEDTGEESANFLNNIVAHDKVQVFGKGKTPAAQSVGGWAVMVLLFSLTGAASSLFEERNAGLFLRLLSGPANRDHILWSKFLHCALLGLLQLVVLVAFGEIAFDIVTGLGQILPLAAICVVTAAAATSFGMFLSSVAKTPAQANGLGTFFILGMSALGGAMFPLFMMPELIQNFIAPLTLVYWAMDGILGVLWRDAGLAGIWINLAVLCGISAVMLAIALRRFRRGDLFR